MDVLYFLKKRTEFIRYYYDEAEKPFNELMRKIEESEPPFDNPPISDYGEPPFLEEWMEAREAINVLGLSCLSLLSDSLKVYFKALQKEIGFETDDREQKIFAKEGFVVGYKIALGEILDTDWSECPADFALIEQIVLGRNSGQHGQTLLFITPSHDKKTLAKHPDPFFIREGALDASGSLWQPNITVSRGNLFLAIEQVEKLAEWIEDRMHKAWEWRERQLNAVDIGQSVKE